MRVRFKEDISGSFSTGKVERFTRGNDYSITQELLNMIAKTLGRSDFYVEIAEGSLLQKHTKVKPTEKKDLSTTKTVDKAKITKRAIKK